MCGKVEGLAVQYPRGHIAIAWVDLATGLVKTNHPGLRATLRRGVKDWEGRVLFPRNGRAFLTAVYDHLFLSGYHVRWMKGLAAAGRPKGQRD